ncbi:uncharacterized protein LOC119649465 isoform X5 [Hermetia illucens]|uniref:uncharacterized protein LOC119649465 isoform X5 n=1 Tax=Hermetia illucens TaxID=343691 RepID=UPI0018CC6C9A|nr:uncharacterized protein LOC119649465 isoform X5 [Hermetia illucens]
MPKHRRRKNQRRLDSKSIKNSQLKNQQLKQLHRDEQAAGDIEQKDRKDSQNEDCLEERYSEEEVEAPADVSNTSCSPADKCGNENLTIDAATAEISGTEPTEIQTLADPDVAGGECCQQHQLTSSAESTCAISEDIIDDQKSSCPYFSDTQADDQVSTTDSTQSVISAAGQPSANNLPSPVSSENVETEIPNATVDLDPAVTGTAPSDDLSTLDLSSTIREPRSHSFSESADTSTLKDESGTGGGSNAGDPTAQSPQPSPDNEISDNQTATTCDITATTTTTSTLTTTTATTKALTGINDQLICDNASETKIDQTIATSREDKHVGENIEEMYSPSGSEAECNQEFSHLETNQSAVASAPARNVPTLSDAVSVISNKIAMLCDEITSAVSQPKNDETDSKPVIMEEAKVSCEVNEQLSEAKDKVESSPSPNVISDSSKSQAGPIDEHQRVLDNPNATPVDTIDTEIIKSISADSITDQMNIDAQDIPAELMKNVKAPTRHPIVQEVITILYPSRVESPKPLRPKRAAYPLTKSKSLDDDDIMIQEMNDASSMGDINENQPMISEASESGTDTDTAPTEFEEKLDPRILSIQTLPLESSLQDHIENNGSQQQPTGEAAHDKKGGDSQDTKARRARNRAALEMHFFPQFLNPRYLDSIKEENSDTSDLDSKSPVRERSSSSLGDLEDDVFSAHASNGRRSSAPATPTTPSTPKADTVFPKSHLDFSHMRKHGPSLRSPQTSVIREESPCYVVETKIIEPPEAVEERCSEWTTKHVATSTEGAEVVYIDSASSSSSDLMELDYTDSTVPGDTTEDESSETIHIETPTIEENEDAANIFGDLEKTPTREIPDTIPETSREVRHFTTVTSVQKSITIQKKEHSERFFNNQELNQNAPQNPLSTDHEKQDNHQQPVNDYTIQNEPDTATIHFPKFPESSSAQNDGVTSDDPSLSRERLSCISNAGQSAVERETLVNNNTSSTSGEQQSTIQRPDFKIGEPCSNNMFATFLNSLIGSNSTNSEDPSQTSSSAEANKQVTGETSNDRGELVRQDSSGSHCSGQSQTTVINRGPPSQTDLADFDIGPCVSGSSNEFAGTEYTYRTVFTYSPKGLRQLCLELLASMPYGNIVLEELASVSESINDLTQVHQKFQELKIKNTQGSEDMPYPLPELPKISDLVVPNRPDVPSHVKLMAAPPTKLQSPPPPPVPDRPKMEEAWLGVPTDQDPSVLVCLSPAQRDYINNSTQSQKSRPDPTPDNLLDMHRKFVERRGYHELPSQLVDKIDRGKSSTEKLDQVVSSTQLRKSTSPPPIPPPPAADLLKEYDETQTKANVNSTATQQSESDSIARGNDRSADGDLADKNNHRLLAIIRDSQQALSSDKQTIQEKVEHQTIVNKSQRTSHTQTQTGPGPEITPRSSDIKDRQPPEVPPRFSTSDSRSHETAASTPRSNPPSEMSSTTSTNFSNNPWCDPFDFGSTDPRKRFSNIELKSPFCTQLMQTQPKRYSNIETTTTTSKKRIENGNVIYDVSDTSKEKITSGDDQLDSKFLNGERDIREKFASDLKFGTAGSDHKTTPSAQQQPSTDAGKTDRKTYEQTSEQHESREEQHHSTKSFSQFFENRPKFSDETSASKEKKDDHFAYDEFRRRAKESAAERAKSEFLERQNYLLKDFDELTKLINEDLFHSDAESKVSKMSTTTTSTRAETADKTKFTDTSETTRGSVPTFADSGPKIPPTGGVRVFNVPINVTGDTKKTEEHFESKTHSETKEHKVYNIPIQVEGSEKKNEMPTRDQPQRSSEFPRSDQSKKEDVPRVRTVPIQIEGSRKQVPSSMPGSLSSTPTGQSRHQRERHLSERRLSSQNLDEWMRYIDDLGASSENITKPLQKEVGLCAFGRRANIRAPRITSEPGSNLTSRLSQSTSNLSTIGTSRDHFFSSHQFGRTNSLIDTTPISPFVTPRNVRRSSLPRELSDSQFEYIRQKEAELREEFDKLESDRRRLMEEMDQAHFKNRLRKDVLHHRSCRLPTLSEDEAFRQQMHDEWLDKVAEREERRLHKIVKISNTSDDIAPEVPSRNMKKAASTTNISDEFLRRVKERRSKLCLPSDSDWESGAESQPAPKREKDTTPPQVKVIEGQSERDFKNLPPHLREFAEITNQIIQQHYHDQETSSTEQRTTKTTSGSDVVKEEGSHQTTSGSKPEPKKLTTILRTNKGDDKKGNKTETRKKETRFKLTPDRRSWSESDLLREIDNALTLSKGFLYGRGVWSPNRTETSTTTRSTTTHSTSSSQQGPPPPPPPPVWSPQASPTPNRKEFRPVKFESPVLPRKYTTQRHHSGPVTPPWNSDDSKPLYNTQSSSCSNLSRDCYTTSQPQQQYQHNLRKSESVGGNLAPRPSVYQLKNEYMSEPESENDRPKKMAQLARRQFDGIGPTTKDGMPIVLRSEVKENNQHQWYKRMYNTLHKAKPHDECVTIRYKTHRGRYPYKSNGYMSEPEPNYDSDYSTMKYHTLDRRRIPSTGSYQEERTYGTMPNPVRSSTGSYKNQPGRIENYVPGHSSVSDKEKKEWWDEVMDIFDGHLEQQKLSNNYTEGYLSRALKEDAYDSDSNLIFRKRQESHFAPLSPIEQKQAYRSVQAGGEPPLQGFRKSAPEKPKDDQEIEYYPITPTLTKIRVHTSSEKQKLPIPPPQQEIICYPITNISRPLDLFAPFPKNVPSFIPVNPPPPPCRKSSRSSTSLKVVSSHYSTSSGAGTSAKPIDARHEACFRSDYYQKESPSNKFGTLTIKKHVKHEPIVRSKSTGAVRSSSRLSTVVKEEKRPTGSTRISRKQLVRVRSVSPARLITRTTDLRKSSPSPVAFGRSISKERMFAEERKRLEQSLPLTRKSFTASTNILKDPALKSAEEVKKAVRTSYTLAKGGKTIPTSSRTASFVGSVTKRNIGLGKKEEENMRVSISSSSRGHESRKDTARVPLVTRASLHATQTSEKKTPKQSTKTSSTLSLARTSSTFSVDSSGSRKKDSKKPLTITRSASRDAATPRTISGRSKPKTKPPPKEIVASSKLYKRIEAERKDGGRVEAELKRELNNSIVEHHEAVRSDNFFQNLFLRDVSPGTSLTENEAQQSYSVLEKAHYWNTLSARSEPSLRRTSVYLSQRKPVSDSKFLTMESKHIHKSRSLSPSYRRSSSGGRVLEQVSKFDSIYQMSDDDESEFGDSRPGKMEELIYKYEQRSSSEPRTRTYLTEVIAPNSPTVIHGRQTLEYSRSVSPVTREIIRPPTREVRSPSRRRIDSLRESQRAETRRVIRASSLSSADDRPRHRIYANSELSHSTGSLNVIERHAAICRHRASHRFKDLNRFYRNLERVGQLERATSSTDLHPIRREGELIDFDVWKKVRAHEKAEKELTHLVDKLKVDQREKDLFFRPKDIADVKWNKRADSGLRCKEKSVEDLKEAFERKAHGEEFEEIRQSEISSSKDIYKPYWRGSSVVDSASSMTVKYNTQPKAATRRRDDPRLFLSNNLISTLSKDQVTKIKSQLSEIYSSSPGPSPKGKCEVKEDYIITVEEPSKSKVDSLKVRCNSSISKEELLGPILRKKEAQIRSMRSESLERRPSPPRPPAQSRTFERISREVSTRSGPELSEVEKKRLSFTISRELQDKVLEHKNRNLSPSLLARETRGAVAAENAKKSLPDPNAVREFISIEQVSQKQSQPQGGLSEERKTIRVRRSSGGESESNTSDISKTTVIYKGKQTDGILPKIKYFEEKKEEEPPKTIYHAREYSSPDEEEVLKAIEEKMKAREREGREKLIRKHTELSSSASDFRELFGERSSNFPVPPPPPPPDEKHEQPHSLDRPPYRSSSLSLSNGSSFESLFRSRSVSPTSRTYYRSYLNAIRTGDVRKMADKFETLNMPPRRNFFELGPPRRIRSDPELNSHVCKEGKSKLHKITVRDHESGDVSWITHKFEMKNSATRGRSRVRKTTSPIPRNPLRKEDRLMPHIDIISKTALLKEEMIKTRSPPRTSTTTFIQSGEVERIRNKFESPERTSLLGQMYTSSPDISQLRDISSYLNASWIAHKYPRRRDNARSPIFPEQGPESIEVKRRAIPPRPSSTSPPRAKSLVTSILKPYYDVFADQKFDPLIHRPISRYVPGERTDDVWNKVRNGLKKYGTSSAVTFEENDVILPPPPPPPPMKNIPMNLNFESGYNYHEESPRRYVEGDVNIHYKSPIRYEFKDAIPEEELARKQAESMKKLYQEERRRKYLQELEDMNNRRHTDNFIPSQKSPIPLNRYDDFPTDVSPKSPASASSSSNFSRTIARALYNFQGQSARELSFKKGDVIYIRRQIDKNWYEGEHNAMVGLLPVNYVEIITKDGSRPAPQKKPSEGQARAKYNFQAQSALELSLNKGELVTLTRRVDANWFEGKIANRKGIFPVTYVDVLTDIGADDSGRSTVSFGNSGSNKPTGNASSRTLITTNNISPTLDQLRTSLNNEFNHVTNGGQHPNGMLRETKTTHKTEVLHVDTNSEPIAYRAIYKYSPQNTDELELFEGDIVYVLEKCDDGWFVGTSQRTGQFGTFPGNYVERA